MNSCRGTFENHKFPLEMRRDLSTAFLQLIEEADVYLRNDNLKEFMFLVESRCEPVNRTTLSELAIQDILLWRAIIYDAYTCCKYILDKGASANLLTPNKDYHSALYIACSARPKSFRFVKLLVDGGADVNLVNNKNESCLMKLCSFPDVDMDSVAYLVEHGADLNITCDNFHTCLTMASLKRNKNLFLFFLQNGAQVNFYQLSKTFPYWILPDWYSGTYEWTRIAVTLCSVFSVSRIGKRSKLNLLSSSLTRELCCVCRRYLM